MVIATHAPVAACQLGTLETSKPEPIEPQVGNVSPHTYNVYVAPPSVESEENIIWSMPVAPAPWPGPRPDTHASDSDM